MRFLSFLMVSVLLAHCGAIGVNYGTLGNNLPSPSRVVQLIKGSPAGFDRAKIFYYDPSIISAFANSGLKLAIAIPNQEVSSFASGSKASDWVRQTVAPFASTIDLICVGNEIDQQSDSSLWNNLVPAMKQIQNALAQNGLSNQIKVTTPITAGILTTSYPPSAGTFNSKVNGVLSFLSSSGSPFMVNVYPYFSWLGNMASISLDYALFRSQTVVVRDGNYGYTNLFDAILDAIIAALRKSGYGNLQVVVGETGWPNAGGDGATVDNAKQYNTELIKKVKTKTGTPRRPGPINIYIFALFNENQKANGVEQHWGLLYPNGTSVYSL